jgi:mono/diheme cytochrome c family protein/glucose/arabinose dehydrogenase
MEHNASFFKEYLMDLRVPYLNFKCILLGCFIALFGLNSCTESEHIDLRKGDHIVLIGNNLGARMINYGYFETAVHLHFSDSLITIRNMCDGGDTPGFRPHSGRNSPWAFPGADKFQKDLAQKSGSEGHFATPDEWLQQLKSDVIIAFFGFNESFEGEEGLSRYLEELRAFVLHTKEQSYNGKTTPKLVLVSPIAFQDLSNQFDLPNGKEENSRLERYSEGMKKIAQEEQVMFVDVFHPSTEWFANQILTIDGSQLNNEGYRIFSEYLSQAIFGSGKNLYDLDKEEVRKAVLEKNWFWQNDYKIPNGVHVFGRRYDPFGPENYPAELEKIREMTLNRDTAIWKIMSRESYDVTLADAATRTLPQVKTNYLDEEDVTYLYGNEALATFTVPEGYKIELFASEQEFPDLANPVQMSFDNKGRLWVATMPSYPHYRPGDTKPNDKLLILEDVNGDGKADKQTVFADGLHLPIGFELAPEGVYISQGTNLKLYTDTDGDDHADKMEILFSGFDDHDTHHAISAFTADPSGAIYMAEGVFLHTNVETSYGPVRATNGGFYRYNPNRRQLERTAQLSIPNPWGIAFDDWGQFFFCETSGPDVHWMMPGSIKSKYGVASPKSRNLIEEAHRVRPTSGLEFVSSRHFPDDVQGDLLINNTIGFLGTKQHQVMPEGTGYKTAHRQDLVVGTDPNFRPVDMEFAPDGSLYLADWHNVLVGHMQHNARDPLRDHVHGRIYRITYPSRPLIKPPQVGEAPISVLLENLKLPEYRNRYRSRRELRGRDSQQVIDELKLWISELDQNDPQYGHYLLEALWVSWGMNAIDNELLETVFSDEDYRLRAAAVRVLRYAGNHIPNRDALLIAAGADEHSQVRLEAIVAATWMEPEIGRQILSAAATKTLDDWMLETYTAAFANLNQQDIVVDHSEELVTDLKGDDLALYVIGKEIYGRDGYCSTCHQPNGLGLRSSGYPPLAGTDWVTGDKSTLIKIALKGVMGKIDVLGKTYPGQVPMTAFGRLLNDQEIASVLTYVRNSFGNKASIVKPNEVAAVRTQIQSKEGYYSADELLKEKDQLN